MYMKHKVVLKSDADAAVDFTDGTFYRYDHKIYTSLQSIINSIGGTNPFGDNVTVEQLLQEKLHRNENGRCGATELELSEFRDKYQIEVFHKGFCYNNVFPLRLRTRSSLATTPLCATPSTRLPSRISST